MPFVIAFIFAVAAFLGWKALQPSCDGEVVAIEEQCRAALGAAFCRDAWPRAQEIARRSGGAFKTQSECLEHYPVCIERADVAGWTARPASFCIARGPSGASARIEPIYNRR